ncbi:5'-3' exonuclease [Dactylosporangium aurantiacum]|uniref:5'-3' exonuclease n=1 Tax=Dactylosporangium aurantiacum TaxID=35754 RepID=A0A9Q9IFE0_9ACTN|nr:5'-3' exonuclease [Dactylosporangium aurantiacum]MDG6108904.1 5'-3' exonuclease [Dactylosporangium aurantiacum]UWZ52198.1 5'-3' exonuclease [Dactylosporangium aurantiacum]
MARPLLLVDSASLYFRAFFGVPEKAALAPDGTPVNAVRGFLDMLSTLVRGRRPDRLVCALDESWRPAWRVALLPSYKAHRLTPAGGEEVPDALSVQVPIILEFLAALGITAVGAPDYEADDVIGTLATREPGPVEVATGDRDLFQLIDDDRAVTVLYCGRGVAKLEVLDDAALRAKYGVPAAGYADLAALRGDPSDGLPGVAGVGEKTAARLVERYGNLDGILAALDDPASGFAPGLRTKIAAGREYLTAARDVVAVARTIPLGDLDTKLPTSPADPDALLALAERWGLAGATKRIVDALAAA